MSDDPSLFDAMDRHQERIEEDESLAEHVRIQMRDLSAALGGREDPPGAWADDGVTIDAGFEF